MDEELGSWTLDNRQYDVHQTIGKKRTTTVGILEVVSVPVSVGIQWIYSKVERIDPRSKKLRGRSSLASLEAGRLGFRSFTVHPRRRSTPIEGQPFSITTEHLH